MDTVSKTVRSRIMSRVRSKDTKPELVVRKWLHRRGFRFRLHAKTLPGHPDIVLPKYKTVVFVNGCFWHRHEGCKRATVPETDKEKWLAKFADNVARDKAQRERLTLLGWHVVVLWQCQIEDGSFEQILEEYFGIAPWDEEQTNIID